MRNHTEPFPSERDVKIKSVNASICSPNAIIFPVPLTPYGHGGHGMMNFGKTVSHIFDGLLHHLYISWPISLDRPAAIALEALR
jgi:hypothetical protein